MKKLLTLIALVGLGGFVGCDSSAPTTTPSSGPPSNMTPSTPPAGHGAKPEGEKKEEAAAGEGEKKEEAAPAEGEKKEEAAPTEGEKKEE
ncbi:MAG: hypothetical protein JSS02_12140 [Planctomycetes bacterium]|nr:hypothetical protein [Planctomycetota bacterium]